MRYFVLLSIFALALYAATAEDIYHIYKTKGINAVEIFLKKEFESKEVKPKEIKEVKVIKEVSEPFRSERTKATKRKAPSEKEMMSKDYWARQLKGVDVSYGFYEEEDSLIVCEKDKKRCDIFRINDNGLKLIKTHDDVIMGKSGDKVKRGDLKTPVGVYEITKRFKPTNQFYGPIAFSLSYPNLFDVLRGKNGDGIWIHGMPLDGKDRNDLSKGCVVMENNAILNLDTEINAKSSIVIIGESKVPKLTRETVATILSEIYKWQHAWKINDVNMYLNFYSKDFKKSNGYGIVAFANMKKQIFARKEHKTIIFDNMSIMPYPTVDDRKLFKVSYDQTYKSPSFAAKDTKELYFELIGDKMHILAEK